MVEFGDSVDPAINARVLTLEAALREAALAGVKETVPTYRSLMIHYEPLIVSRAELVAALERLSPRDAGAFAPKTRWRLPCCYDTDLAEDIVMASQMLALAPERLAALHAGGDYRVYMYGFAPGWCYLGGLPNQLALPRRASPRGPTPQGAVLIGGGLSLVATNPMPTGWYVIGLYAGSVVCGRARPANADRARRRLELRTHRRRNLPEFGSARCARRSAGAARGLVVNASLRIHSAGPGATVQDAGRADFLRFGVTPAGPMDQGAFIAALLASGEPDGAAIEASLGGMELTAEGEEVGLAIAGGAFDLRLDGHPLPTACTLHLAPGARLSVRSGIAGAWCYITPFGSFDLPKMLGSLATHTRSGVGGLAGRMLRGGDILRIVDPRPAPPRPRAISAPWLDLAPGRLRVLVGTAAGLFFIRDNQYISVSALALVATQRPHGLPIGRTGARASQRPRHHLRRTRLWSDTSPRRRRAARAYGRPPANWRLS